MFGNNPIRRPLKGDGSNLEVQEIFKTFQGEGPFTGRAAVFVRLGGCNLACDFCDTEFESFSSQSLEQIEAQVNALAYNDNKKITHSLVVITGGEPFRQPIAKLCSALLNTGYDVQIETNGTLFQPIDERVTIVCSPKTSKTGYHPIRSDLLCRINAFKFIVSAQNPAYATVGNVGQKEYNTPIYVQPMDEQDKYKNNKNTELALSLVKQHGYRLSLQTHKIVGAP